MATRRSRVLTAALVVALALTGASCSPSKAPRTPTPSGTSTQQATVTPDEQDNVATSAQVDAEQDAFHIRNIYATRPGGTIWTSQWDDTRSFDGVDPVDPWFDADHGSGSYRVDDGQLFITGDVPRMYVYDPAKERQWRDVEATMYFKRVSDTGIPYAGMTIVARSNHLDTESGRFECDTRGYGGRMRYGHTDFEKETAYPINQAVANKDFWRGSLPKNRWIGLKFIVYDVAGGVRLELWTDLTDGRAGGAWKMIDAVTDDGNLFGYEACARGIDPQMPLTGAPDRKGSESGRPNLTVYFRSDGVNQDGLVYKWGSIREITPRPTDGP
jgi:hypothetical protein